VDARFRTDGGGARAHIPEAGAGSLCDYKEWWHFNLFDEASGLEAVVNFSVAGNLYRAGSGTANLIALAHLPDLGWVGAVEPFDGLATRLSQDRTDVSIGQSSLRSEEKGYRLRLCTRDGRLAADLHFEICAEPLTVWKDTPLGEGHINWMLFASMAVRGSFRCGDRTIELAGARGYHDHNWGAWRWGGFGWTWGFCCAGSRGGAGTEDEDSLVYNASLGPGRHRILEQSLLLWRGDRLVKIFLRDDVASTTKPGFAGPVPRIPGAMKLIDPSRVTSVPRRIELSARDGPDWIQGWFEPDIAIQIAVPRETDFGLVELNEALGRLVAEGEVGGKPVRIRRRACFEFVG
jgi:hypothetical protein